MVQSFTGCLQLRQCSFRGIEADLGESREEGLLTVLVRRNGGIEPIADDKAWGPHANQPLPEQAA